MSGPRRAARIDRVSATTLRCRGCQAVVPAEDGPTHPYMLSAPACWRIYGEVLAREYSEPRWRRAHRLAVDAYAVQHAENEDRRNRQSVALHLMSLALVLERGAGDEQARRMLSARSRGTPEFPRLEPPTDPGRVTVLDVHAAADAAAHVQLVGDWAQAAWAAWSDLHPRVRSWLDGDAV